MIMAYLTFVLCLIGIRAMAGYDSRCQNGKYVTLKSDFLSRVLLSQSVAVERKKRLKKDKNKMSVCGTMFYAAAGFTLLVNLFFLLVDDIPVKPWELDAGSLYIYVDTLNEKVSALLILLLFGSIAGYYMLLIFRTVKMENVKPKWCRIFLYGIELLMAVTVVACLGCFLFELGSCFVS